MIDGRILKFVHVPGHIYQIWSLKTRHHVPSTVRPGKESLTSNFGSQHLDKQLDHVATLCSSFISCTSLDKAQFRR